jgi:arsenate reductase
LLAELLGSAFLAALVIGSGIAAQQLSPHDLGLELLENAAATAAELYAIILMFGPISGGHFNPVVSFVDASFGGITRRDALAYLPAQVTGCVLAAIVANGMFAKAAISISTHHRASPAHLLAEMIATLGLILIILAVGRSRGAASVPAVLGAYIGAAYFFTSSTSFANPAITVGGCSPTRSPGSHPHPRPATSSRSSSAARPLSRRSELCIQTSRRLRPRRWYYLTQMPMAPGRWWGALDEHRPVRLPPERRALPISQALFTRAAAGRHRALSAGTTPRRARPPRGARGHE